MDEVLTSPLLRDPKFPKHRLIQSEFVPSRLTENTSFMLEDLAASGLTPEDISVTVEGNFALPAYCIAGYVINYTSPDGEWLTNEDYEAQMWRMKLKYSTSYRPDKKPPKYDQPKKEELAEFGISTSPPYIPPAYHLREKTPQLAICEGEKKTACVAKYIGISAIGIGGCWTWRDKATGEVNDWIVRIARQHTEIYIVPDGDLRRYDICKAYGTFCSELKARLEGWEGEIFILEPPDKIDDLIVKWGLDSQYNFWELPKANPGDLVEDPTTLAKQYDLAFRETEKGQVKVYEHTHNIQTLIERHPAFPEIWLDLDNNKPMIGEESVVPGVTEMKIANHFQYNFQMPTVRDWDVDRVIKALATQASKSPFLEWIEDQVWDGVPRLDTWMLEHWGVEDSTYVREISAKFFIASVARQREPGCKVDWMMITTGGQGIGKSTMPDIVFQGHISTVLGNQGDKDIQMLMHSGLCIVLDELDALNAKEADFWKSAITTREDRFRPPYGREVHYYKRRSILYGTSNSDSFLAGDPSGYRRYKPVKVSRMLNFRGLQEAIPQLWAEAAARHKLGEQYWDVSVPPEQMEQHAQSDVLEEQILEFLKGIAINANGNRMFYGMVGADEIMEVRLKDLVDGAGITNPTQRKTQTKIYDYLEKFGGEKRGCGNVWKQKCIRFGPDALRQLRA